jgi:hypothetical protein
VLESRGAREDASVVYPLRKVEDGFGRMLGAEGLDEWQQHKGQSAHRIRKGTGRRVGLVLSCDGWGATSDTLP